MIILGNKGLVREAFFHFICISGIILLAGLPLYIKIQSSSKVDAFYTVPHNLIQDYYFYLTAIEQGKTQLFVIDPYTNEQTEGQYLHFFYNILGRIAAYTGVSNITMYYLGIFVPLILYYIFTYLLVKQLLKSFRWLAMFLIFFSGPLPEFTANINGKTYIFLSTWWSKMDVYQRLTHVPHHFFGISLLVGVLYFSIRYYHTNKSIYFIVNSVLLVIGTIFFAWPFMIYAAALSGTCLIDIFVRRNSSVLYSKAKYGFLIFIIIVSTITGFIYFHTKSLGEPWARIIYWENWFFSRENESFNILNYLANFGILLPLGIIGSIYIIKRYKFDYLLILMMCLVPVILWIAVVFDYIHLGKQRLVLTAPYVFMGIISVFGLSGLWKNTRYIRLRNILVGFIISVSIGISLLSIYTYFIPNIKPEGIYSNIFLDRGVKKSLDYLYSIAQPGDNVFTDFMNGMYVPPFTNMKAYIGHEWMTIDFKYKNWFSDSFYQGNLDEESVRIEFENYNIKYVFWNICTYPDKSDNYKTLIMPIFSEGCANVYKII